MAQGSQNSNLGMIPSEQGASDDYILTLLVKLCKVGLTFLPPSSDPAGVRLLDLRELLLDLA